MDKSRRSHLEIDNVMDDVIRYYKDKEFNPKIPLKVHFTGQPGVDASGLTRQLYTMFFGKLCNTTFSNHLFEGESKNKVPVCRTYTCLSEIFVYVGVIIAHALSQGCRPPLHLSSAAYHYIVTGKIEEVLEHINVSSLASPGVKHFVKEVS